METTPSPELYGCVAVVKTYLMTVWMQHTERLILVWGGLKIVNRGYVEQSEDLALFREKEEKVLWIGLTLKILIVRVGECIKVPYTCLRGKTEIQKCRSLKLGVNVLKLKGVNIK